MTPRAVSHHTIIIGAGVIGCAIARELTARGAECTLVDDRAAGGGATQASAGMLAPYVEAHDPGPLRDLGVRSLGLYDAWIASVIHHSGMEVEYRRIGTLEVALDPLHASELRATASLRRDVPSTFLEGAEARQHHPALGRIAGALFTAAHGYVAPRSLTAALLRSAELRGATLCSGRVRAIRRAADNRMDVKTDERTLQADCVVLAAGAWASGIAAPDGRLPEIRPVRGQLLHLRWQGPPIETVIWGPECYVVPRTDGTLLVGATVEEVGFDERATASAVRDLLDAVSELLPAAWDATFLGVRVGLRPASADDLPVLGPDPQMPALVHATGHYRNGVLLAPLTAQLIADWVLDGTRDPAFDVLGPGRF